MTDEDSRPSLLTLSIVINMLLAAFLMAMSWALEFVLEEHAAGLLAASATWSVQIFLSSQDQISLRYRSDFLVGSYFVMFIISLNVAHLIVGVKSNLLVPIVVAVLILPMIAVNTLLERIVFTADERQEIKSRKSQRTRVV